MKRAESALVTSQLLPVEPDAAWADVLSAARNWAPGSQSPTWPNADIKRAVNEMGGLRMLALAETDDVPWLRKTFVERYAEYRRRRIATDDMLMAQSLPSPEHNLSLPETTRR